MLEVRHISKKYGGEAVLTDVSLSLMPGQSLLLQGENGTGKTTLLLIIAGLLKPDSGEILLDGKNDTKGKIAYVPQEPALLNSLSVKDNLRFWGTAAGLSTKAADLRIKSLSELLGLDAAMKKKISTLSGGMKKRVNLAVSLFGNPRLLLLDEPFANVDAETKAAVFGLLNNYLQKGCSLLLVSHSDKDSELFADRALLIENGKLKIEN